MGRFTLPRPLWAMGWLCTVGDGGGGGDHVRDLVTDRCLPQQKGGLSDGRNPSHGSADRRRDQRRRREDAGRCGFAPIYQAWLDHNVIVVRDQELTIPEFLAYSRRFGPVEPHPSKSTRHPDIPRSRMLGINKFGADGKLNDGDLPPRRRGLAHRRRLRRRAVQGDAALRAGDAEHRRRHAVCQHATPPMTALPERLKQRLDGVDGAFTYGGRRKAAGAAERGRPRPGAGVSPDHPRTSRNRAQVAVFRSRQDPVHRRCRAGGKRRR